MTAKRATTREQKQVDSQPAPPGEIRDPHEAAKSYNEHRWAGLHPRPRAPDDATPALYPHLFWEGLSDYTKKKIAEQAPGGVGEDGKPTHWPRSRPVYPCPRCDRVLTKRGHQAIMCYGHHGGRAYLECRLCGKRFSLPILGA